MARNPLEPALESEQRMLDLRKLNEALKPHSPRDGDNEMPASAKLAEAILRAQRSE